MPAKRTSGHIVQDEGTSLGQAAFLNFVGAGVSVATTSGVTTATISGANNDGWVDDSANTWTRTANQTFTVSGDRTAVFQKGTRLRWTQTTVKYGVVIGSSHAAGTTTVTIAATPDYVLTAAAISVNSYSYAASPQGYPDWFNFTPTYTGFSADPTLGAGAIAFAIIGRTCIYSVNAATNGTSNAAGYTITMPVASLLQTVMAGARITNNGTVSANTGVMSTTAGSATLSILRDATGVGYTASGGKLAQFTFVYPF